MGESREWKEGDYVKNNMTKFPRTEGYQSSDLKTYPMLSKMNDKD